MEHRAFYFAKNARKFGPKQFQFTWCSKKPSSFQHFFTWSYMMMLIEGFLCIYSPSNPGSVEQSPSENSTKSEFQTSKIWKSSKSPHAETSLLIASFFLLQRLTGWLQCLVSQSPGAERIVHCVPDVTINLLVRAEAAIKKIREWVGLQENWCNESLRTILQGRHRQSDKEPIGDNFKQSYNQELSSRYMGSNKQVVQWRGVVIEVWKIAICRLILVWR